MPSTPKIFLSYRRADSAETTTRLYDRLVYAFGRENVFKDVDSIQRGDDFPDVLREWVMSCDVFLTVIGQHWLTLEDKSGKRRIDDEKDWVRRETQMALERDKSVVLIPTVVDGGALPGEDDLPDALKRLASKHIQTLRTDNYFHGDVSALITWIRHRFDLADAVPSLDLRKAHRDLGELIDAKEWDAAREILVKMRAVGNVPAYFLLDEIEVGIYKQVTEEQRTHGYQILARNADLVDKGLLAPQEMTAALDDFIQIYGSFLPKDDWARVLRFLPVEKPPVPSSHEIEAETIETKPSPTFNTLQDLLNSIDAERGTSLPALIASIEAERGTSFSAGLAKSGLTNIASSIMSEREKSPRTNPVEATLERARSFTGTRNREWTPVIVTFNDLKIPDMPFCLVPVGSFQMGAEDIDVAKPAHTQTIAEPYFIAQYPVTNAQWKLAVGTKMVKEPEGTSALAWYNDPQMADAPVVGVTWDEAHNFADWISCRLPNELEWEYAARGVENLIYPWGNGWKPNACVWSENTTSPAPIATRIENVSWVGARHLNGNVWEWTASIYSAYPYRFSQALEELGATGERVLRGGSWKSKDEAELRLANRAKYVPFGRLSVWGLRLARSL